MHRLALVALALSLTACQTERRPALGPQSVLPTFIQGFDANNQPTMTSYAGRTSAGAGQLSDTSEAEIIKALAEKIEPGTPFAYSHIVKSDIVQPNVDIEAKLEQESKDALLEAGKALAAGAQGQYAKALDRAGAAGEKLIAVKAAKANAPKPDSGANSTHLLAVGPDSGLTTVAAVATYGKATEAKQRASYGATTDTKTTDTTTPADIDSITAQMREARLAWEARNKVPAAVPGAPGVIALPVPAVTNAPPAVVTSPGTNVVETIVLPEFKP